MARVLVVGAGVTGLSCAVRLLERGHEVGVVARDLPLETTSAVAAALWYPYLADPPDRVAAWAHTTYAELARLAADPETGIALRPGTEVLRRRAIPPAWLASVPGAGPTSEVPRGYESGWTFVAPVVETPIYLRWLTGRVDALGGTVTRMALAALPDQAEVVVDAAGLGARLLAQDPSVVPVRGQVVYVEQVGLDRWWLDDAGPTYVIPRSRDIVVGGTEERGAWDRRPDPAVADELLRRATALVPELRGARVLGHRVGLRPARPAVRLEEAGPVPNRPSGSRVVHCYGHGGSGVTLSWGCADEVAALVGDA
jgi:D-amino-acid oxidase